MLENVITFPVDVLSQKWRRERFRLFQREVIDSGVKSILDLGGGDGQFMTKLGPEAHKMKIVIADIDDQALERASNRGFEVLHLDGRDDKLPFDDRQFDVIFCNSVIEHVTGLPELVCGIKDDCVFRDQARARQFAFAAEIRRCAKAYFVQSPHWRFPIEPHTWFPLTNRLSRRNQIRLIGFFNACWIKQTTPNWFLLSENEMSRMFPDAQIIIIKKFGFPKELIALKKKCVDPSVD